MQSPPALLIDSLEHVVERDYPFMPLSASALTTEQMRSALFGRELELSSTYLQNMSVVVGRRGAGKTTFLQSAYLLAAGGIVVEIDKARCLAQVVLAVHGMPTGGRFPEAIAEIWDGIIQTTVLSHAAKKYPDLKLCRDYLGKIGATGDMTADKVAWLVIDTLRDSQKGKTLGSIAELVRKLHSVSFEDAKTELIKRLRIEGRQAIVLVDSLESEGYLLDDDDTRAAIAGLLYWAGKLNAQRSPLSVNVAIPGEYYFEFVRLSANPLKDFARLTHLRWRTKDLLQLAHSRLLTYYYFYDRKRYVDWAEAPPQSSKHSLALFKDFLPAQIALTDGQIESTLLYVLRHSQCLPRQIFILLNGIYRRAKPGEEVTAADVYAAVGQAGELVIGEILGAFRHRYPLLEQVVQAALPNFPSTFPYGYLDKAFYSFGKAWGVESHEFERMLIDAGIVGKIVSKTAMYTMAEFQYNVDRPLTFSGKDQLCLHPLFQLVFQSQLHVRMDQHVYPVGLAAPSDG